MDQICAPSGENARCTSCVIDLLDVLEENGFGNELFTEEGFAAASQLILPAGSRLTEVNISMVVSAIALPLNFSRNCTRDVSATTLCPEVLIINESMVMQHLIDGTVLLLEICVCICLLLVYIQAWGLLSNWRVIA